jgi:ubiquinone/menaquinone biosynthesis C-methylase UbiE
MWMGSKPSQMRFFRESSLEQLPVSIAGIKLGDRLIMLGCSAPKLIAQLAVKTGLTGRACAVDQDARRTARAAEVAPREGALIETTTTPWTSLPFDNAAFDVAIVRDVFGAIDLSSRSAAVAELLRVLRPGGRCLVMDSVARGGLGGLFVKKTALADYDALRTLETGAFRAVRTVAEREGLKFVEGVKENS